jgi:hypothetical protein
VSRSEELLEAQMRADAERMAAERERELTSQEESGKRKEERE